MAPSVNDNARVALEGEDVREKGREGVGGEGRNHSLPGYLQSISWVCKEERLKNNTILKQNRSKNDFRYVPTKQYLQ